MGTGTVNVILPGVDIELISASDDPASGVGRYSVAIRDHAQRLGHRIDFRVGVTALRPDGAPRSRPDVRAVVVSDELPHADLLGPWPETLRLALVLPSRPGSMSGDSTARIRARTMRTRWSPLARCDRVVVHSDAVARELLDTTAVAPDALVAMPLPPRHWPTPAASAVVEDFARTHQLENRPVALHVGRLTAPRGIERLIDAWAGVVSRHPDALLILVGAIASPQTDILASILHQRVARLDLGRSVRFVGPQTEESLVLWYGASDLVVVGPDPGDIGWTLVEAGHAGRPVVVPDVGGAVEQVDPDGSVYRSLSSRSLRAALCRLLDEPTLRSPSDRDARLQKRITEDLRAAALWTQFWVDLGSRHGRSHEEQHQALVRRPRLPLIYEDRHRAPGIGPLIARVRSWITAPLRNSMLAGLLETWETFSLLAASHMEHLETRLDHLEKARSPVDLSGPDAGTPDGTTT